MNFQKIIKQEWEKEFPLGVDEQPAIFDKSIFESVYQNMVERICIRVWNEALEVAMQNVRLLYAEVDVEGFPHREPVDIDYTSIANLIIDEQGTDTTEV